MACGVNSISPACVASVDGTMRTVPCTGVLTSLTVRLCPLSLPAPRESFLMRLAWVTYRTVSSGVVAVSSAGTGLSLTAFTVMETVAVFESRLPSFALKVKLSGPL